MEGPIADGRLQRKLLAIADVRHAAFVNACAFLAICQRTRYSSLEARAVARARVSQRSTRRLTMPPDLDSRLRDLSTYDHPDLEKLETMVLARIHRNRETRGGIGMVAAAAIGAVALGSVAAGPSAHPAHPLAPFGIAAPLAPSTLLTVDR